MRVRWQDVAQLAGVSEATVSRVMNGRPGVSERTRAAVLRAADQLGARELLRRRVDPALIAIVVPDLDNPIFPALAQLIESRLAGAGHTSVLGSATRFVDELDYVDVLVAHGVAGVILISGRHADRQSNPQPYRDAIERGLPIVFVNGYSPDIPASFVSCDDRRAATLAVQHLVGLGHRRIGFVAGPERYVVSERKLAGYRAALAAAGVDVDDELVVPTMFTVEGGRAVTMRLIERGATAAITANDLIALGTILAAREHGLRVPDEWSVVGYDDTMLMAYTDPPLTTIRQPIRTMSDHAARLLLEQMNGSITEHREYLFRPELVLRSSTAAATARARS